MKRNIGAVGDNTEMVLDEAVYILGELEIWKLAIEKMKTNRYVKQDNGWV